MLAGAVIGFVGAYLLNSSTEIITFDQYTSQPGIEVSAGISDKFISTISLDKVKFNRGSQLVALGFFLEVFGIALDLGEKRKSRSKNK